MSNSFLDSLNFDVDGGIIDAMPSNEAGNPSIDSASTRGAGGYLDPEAAIRRVAQEEGVNPDLLIPLAQLETRLGGATIKGGGQDTNNLFNIKDFSKAGTGIRANDKAEGSNHRYRQYSNFEESTRDVIQLLRSNPRYQGALDAQDPTEFATILKNGGYATDPNYVSKFTGVANSRNKPGAQAAKPMRQVTQQAGDGGDGSGSILDQFSNDDVLGMMNGGGNGLMNVPAKQEKSSRSFLDVLGDTVIGVGKIGPTALKGAAEIGNMLTGDSVDLGIASTMQRGMEAMDGFGSERFKADKAGFAGVMQDDTKGIGDMFAYALDNPSILVDNVIPTLGSMFLPAGAAKGAVMGAKAIGVTASTAEKAAVVASIGTGAAQNAAEVFSDLKGRSMEERYAGATISFATSALIGIATGGGADGAIARRMAGDLQDGKIGIEAVKGFLKSIGKETTQETFEETGNIAGKAAGSGKAPTMESAKKQVAFAGALGGIVGGGVHLAIGGHSGHDPQLPATPDNPSPAPPAPSGPLTRALDAAGVLPATTDPLTAPASPPADGLTSRASAIEQLLRGDEQTPGLMGRMSELDDDGMGMQGILHLLETAKDPAAPIEARESSLAALEAALQVGATAAHSQGMAADATPSDVPLPPEQTSQADSSAPQAPIYGTEINANRETPQPARVLQPRQRNSAASIQQMKRNASNLDYLQVGPSSVMGVGAPIVFGDLPSSAILGDAQMVTDMDGGHIATRYAIVEAGDVIASNRIDGTSVREYETGAPGKLRTIVGNGRKESIDHAYDIGTAQQKYLPPLLQSTKTVGISAQPQQVEAMRKPMLVRIMDEADVTDNLGAVSNHRLGLESSDAEQAANDARDFDFGEMAFDEHGEPTHDAIRRFIASLPKNDTGNLITSDDRIAPKAIDRMKAATFAHAYEDDALTSEVTMETDPDAKRVLEAAMDAAGVMAALKGKGEFDVSLAVADAIRLAVNAKRSGFELANMAQNQDIAISDEGRAVARVLGSPAIAGSSKRMATALRRWGMLALQQARIAEESQYQGSLVPPVTLSREQLFDALGSDSNPTEQAVEGSKLAQERSAAVALPVQQQASKEDAAPALPTNLSEAGPTDNLQLNAAGKPFSSEGAAKLALRKFGYGTVVPVQGGGYAIQMQGRMGDPGAVMRGQAGKNGFGPNDVLPKAQPKSEAKQGESTSANTTTPTNDNTRPANWETSYGPAKAVAESLGIALRNDSGKFKKLPELVTEIKAVEDAQAPASQIKEAPFNSFEAKSALLETDPSLVNASGQLNAKGDQLSRTPWQAMSEQDREMVQKLADARQARYDDYNQSVEAEYRDIEKRRLEGQRIILAANGKPFKTSATTQRLIDEKGIADTHTAQQIDGGWAAKRMTPADINERENVKLGIEPYMVVQERVVKELGLTDAYESEEPSEGLSEEQWQRINERTEAIQRQQRGLAPLPEAPTPTPTPKQPAAEVPTLEELRAEIAAQEKFAPLQKTMKTAKWVAEEKDSTNTVWHKLDYSHSYTASLDPESASMTISVNGDSGSVRVASFSVTDPLAAAVASNRAIVADAAQRAKEDGVKRGRTNGFAEVWIDRKKHLVTEYDDKFVIREKGGSILKSKQGQRLFFATEAEAIEYAKSTAQQAAPEAPTLTPYTPTDIEQRQAQQAQATRAEAASQQTQTTTAAAEDERKRIAAASVKAADSFELGQDPMDSLTGQKNVFGAMEEAPEPPAWSPESHVQIAADSVANLRKDDVYRLFDELPKEADNFHDLRVHIIGNRPDLAGAVMEAIGEIGMPNRKAATQDDENRLAESKARVLARGQAVKDYLASGGTVRHANQLRVTPLNHPSQIKVSKDGVRMQAGRDKSAPDGVRWAYLTFGEVDQLASQVPGLDPDLAPDFVRGMAEAKLEQQEQQAQAAPKNLKKGIERAQQNAQSAKAAEITTNEGSNRVGKFAYDIEPTSGYMLAEFSGPPTADGLRIGAENAEELKQQIQRAMDTHDASPYLKMRWKRPGAGQVTLVKLVSLPNSADKSELYEVTFSGGGSMRIDAHRMEESAARDSEAASEEGMAKAKIEREAYQKAEEAAKQSEKDQAARAEAFNLEVKRFADSMGYTALRAGSVRAALKRVHNYEGMGIMSALEFMKKMVANGHAPVEHLPVPQGKPQLHETLGMTDEQVSKFKARRLKNDTTPIYTISGFDITKTESDFAKYLQEGIAQAQQNAAQATQQAENLAWVEKSTGYEPARPEGRPYVLKAGELGRATTVAGKFGEKPKFSDANRYFASPEEAQDWGKANGYLVGSNPYAITRQEVASLKEGIEQERQNAAQATQPEPVAPEPNPEPDELLSNLTLGYGYPGGISTMPSGLGRTARALHKAILGGDAALLEEILDPSNKLSRKAFESLFKGKLKLPRTIKGTRAVIDDFVEQVKKGVEDILRQEVTSKTLARSAAEKVLGDRFELSENDKEAKNVSAIAGTKDAYITQDGKELHIVEAVANENLKKATTEAIQEALAKRSPGTDAAKRLQAELDSRGGVAATERYATGKSLTKEQRKQVLSTLVDVYKVKGAPREVKSEDGERYGYKHSPELFEKSDITGAMVRYYVTLPDGRIAHPTELFPGYSQSDIDAALSEQQAKEETVQREIKRNTAPEVQFDERGEANKYWNLKSLESASSTGRRSITRATERTALTNNGKIVLVPNDSYAGMESAYAEAGWKKEETLVNADQPEPRGILKKKAEAEGGQAHAENSKPIDVQETIKGAVNPVDNLSKDDFDKVAAIFGVGDSVKPKPAPAASPSLSTLMQAAKDNGKLIVSVVGDKKNAATELTPAAKTLAETISAIARGLSANEKLVQQAANLSNDRGIVQKLFSAAFAKESVSQYSTGSVTEKEYAQLASFIAAKDQSLMQREADKFIESARNKTQAPVPAAKAPSTDIDLDAMFDDVLAEEMAKDAAKEQAAKPKNLKEGIAKAQKEKADSIESLLSELKERLSSLGGRAIDAGDGKLAGRILTAAPQNASQAKGYLTRKWVEDSVHNFEKEVLRLEKKRGASHAKPIAGPVPPPNPRTAGQAATSAAKNAAAALTNAIDGLGALFGQVPPTDGTINLNSGLPANINADTYNKAKPLFQQAVANLGDASSDLKEAMRAIVRMVMDKFGAQAARNMQPYVVQFVRDMQNEQPASTNNTPTEDATNDSTTAGYSDTVNSPMGSGLQPEASTAPIRGARKPSASTGRGDDGDLFGAGGRPNLAAQQGERLGDGSGPAAVQLGANDVVAGSGGGVSAANYRPTTGGLTRQGSWFDTAKRNIDLIEMAIQIENEGRPATPQEQEQLSKYVGFGAGEIRNNLFPVPPAYAKQADPTRLIWPNHVRGDNWRKLAERMEALPTEWQKSVLQSTQYAHYTSENIVRSVWSGIERMGFTGGKVFEPGMGIGSFAMLMPEGIAATSAYTGVEFDGPTALIAKLLSPKENVIHGDFIKRKFPKDYFDVNVGNPPFSKTRVLGDPVYAKQGFMLHDFFFAKAIDSLRPGGLQVFVTSKGTMDKQNDRARQYLAARADLLGAIRLPSTAFEGNAGTSVVTDVIFLRKRLPGEAQAGHDWGNLATTETKDGPALVNEYFATHPEMVLGQQRISGNMDDAGRRINSNGKGGEKYTVVSYDSTPAELDAKFAKAIEQLPENAFSVMSQTPERIKAETARVDFDPAVKHDGAIYLAKDGALMRTHQGAGHPLESSVKISEKDKAWLTDYVGLRDLVQLARHAQHADSNWEASLKKLNKAYDAFRKKHGPILNYRTQTRKSTDEDGNIVETETRILTNKRLFREDYDQALLTSIERITESGEIVKAAFLNERTIGKPVQREIKSIGDALAVSLDSTGLLDLNDVAKRIGLTRSEVIDALDNQIYQVPGGQWQLADEYLSGNVVAKLEEAIEAARLSPGLERNVEALKAVQPEKLGPTQISAKLGASWIPESHINAFAQEIGAGAVTFDFKTETWQVVGGNLRSGRTAGAEYGTIKKSPSELLEAALNSRSVKITTVTEDKKTVTDEEGTAAANEVLKKIKDKFKGWVWTDTDRATELVESYNRLFNNLAPRRFDGSHMTLPGVSLRFKLHPHQLRAILRQVQTGNTYLAHAVGAGKTIEMIAGGMEQKRLGLIQKPMYVVPNHMLEQFSNEFMELYPLANIMVADDENFSAERRKSFIAAATLNAPDAVVITHDAFQRIGVTEESVAPIRDAILTDLEMEMASAAKDGDARVRRSQLQQQIEAVTQRFDRIVSAGNKDATVKFEEMGVDFLYVDEAHAYRKLDFHTGQQIKGIDPNGSKRAMDMYVKTQVLQRKRPGRSMVFASGTPVTNTMGELYTILRFFAPEMLEEGGIASFDAWSRQFAEVSPALEQNAAGKYELVERFSKFDNVPELMSRVRMFMDVLNSEHLGALVKRPDIKGGKPNLNIVPATPALKQYMEGDLAKRIEISKAWKPSPQQKGNPDPIVSIITDGRFAAIDPRFFGRSLAPGEESIITTMASSVVEKYKAFSGNVYFDKSGKPESIKGGTQIVFYNLGFGDSAMRNRGFDSRTTFTKLLTDGGIPRAEIAWFDDANTDAKKEAIFKDMRSGKLKVLIGSAKKMGTGVNVQNRLAALHYQDPPWYPSDVEQPHGRIIRQGNQNTEAAIEWYTTKGTYQSTMWQMVARKQRFIDQAFTGDKNLRSMEDLGEASLFEQAAAVASGDPRAIQLAGLKQDVERLERLSAAHASEQVSVREALRSAESGITYNTDYANRLDKAFKSIDERHFSFTQGAVKGITYTKHGEFGQAVKDTFNRVAANAAISPTNGKSIKIADLGKGVVVSVRQLFDRDKPTASFKLLVDIAEIQLDLGYHEQMGADVDAVGLSQRLANIVNKVGTELQQVRGMVASTKAELVRLKKKNGAPFEYAQEMAEKHSELKTLEAELIAEGATHSAPIANQPADAPSLSRQQPPTTPATPIATVRAALTQAYGKLADQLEQRGLVTVVQTQEQAIEAAAQARAAKTGQSVEQAKRELMASVDVKRSADGNVQGFFDPQTGQAFLVADHLTAEAAPGVLMHEVGIHMAADKTLAPLFNRAKMLLKAQRANAFMQRVQAKMDAAGETSAEEVAAYMVEAYESDRTAAPASVGKWLSDLLASVKAWMHRKGIIGADGLTVADIAAVARANAKSLAQGQAGRQSSTQGIRFSRTPQWQPPPATQGSPTPTWEAFESGKWDEFAYNWQDRHIDTKRTQQAIAKSSGPIVDDMNVRQREELFHGRNANAMEIFQKTEVDPLQQQLRKDKIELESFEEYLHARHAPEANAVMAERNPSQAMINAGRAQAAQEIGKLAQQSQAPGLTTVQKKILSKALANSIRDLNRWNKVTAYSGTEEDRLMLSNMSDLQAQAIMAGLTPEARAGMERSAALFDAIVAKNRRTMVDNELESQATIDSWANLFQHYVPLMREEVEGFGPHGGIGTGQGISIKGREVKSRTGSASRKVVDIVANLVAQRERTIERGEKRRVAITLMNLAEANPNPDFWQVGAPDKVQQYDPATRTVKWVTDPQYKSREDVVVAKKLDAQGNIEEVALTFNDKNPQALRMAAAMKNLDDASLNKLLQIVAPATRMMAALSTIYNPMWGIFNFARDTFGAMVSLGSTPLHGQGARRKIYFEAISMLPALIRDGRMVRSGGTNTSASSALFHEFSAVGGATGFRDMIRTSNERSDRLKASIDPDAWMETGWGKVATLGGTIKPLTGGVKQAAEWVLGGISDLNMALENATRISVYKASLEMGLSKERSASIAKNITVNFNRRGAIGSQVGAAFAFFNASVQGNVRIAEALTVMKTPGDPRTIRLTEFGRNVVLGSLAIGAIQAIMLAAAGFGPDEPPEHVKDRNITIPTDWTGIGPDKGYVNIPMPLGYNVLPAFGRRLVEFAMGGGKDVFKHLSGITGLILNSANPIGSGTFLQTITPTVLDPIVSAIENVDSFGKPIARVSLDRNVPGHQLSKGSATGLSKWASEKINAISGGDKYTRGQYSPSPDQLDYAVVQYGGGISRELVKIWESAGNFARGEDVPLHKIPLIGRLGGKSSGQAAESTAYYANLSRIDKIEKRIDGLREDGRIAESNAERRNAGPYLLAQARTAEREIKLLRKVKEKAIESGNREAVTRAESRITAAMRRVNDAMAKSQRPRA